MKEAVVWRQAYGPLATLRDNISQPALAVDPIPQVEDSVQGGSFTVAGARNGSYFVYKAYSADDHTVATPLTLRDIPVKAQVLQQCGQTHPVPSQMSELLETGTPTLICPVREFVECAVNVRMVVNCLFVSDAQLVGFCTVLYHPEDIKESNMVHTFFF